MTIYDILGLKPSCGLEEVKEAKENFDQRSKRINVPEGWKKVVKEHYELIMRIGTEEYNKRIIKLRYKQARGDIDFDIFNDENFKDDYIQDQELEFFNRHARINAANKLLDEYSNETPRMKAPEKKKNKRKFIIVGSVIMAGVLTVVGFNAKQKQNKLEDINSNVCVEYVVQEGDSKSSLDKIFEEYGNAYYEVSGLFRNNDIVYAGDVVIGRTTKEKADELVASGNARIISIDEAVELLGENHSLIGEFRNYANGESDFVFYVPEGKQMI